MASLRCWRRHDFTLQTLSRLQPEANLHTVLRSDTEFRSQALCVRKDNS